jgi:hypothetical protein
MSPALSVIDDALIIKYSGAWGSMVQLILIFQRFEQDRLILGHVREVPPVVPRSMPQHEDFSVSVAVAQLHRAASSRG